MRLVSRTIRNLALVSTVALTLGIPACVAATPRKSPRGESPAGDPSTKSPSGSVEAESGAGSDLARAVVELVEAHNRVRAAHRRPPLAVSAPLEAAAREHALDMSRHRWMSHRGSDFSSPFRRMAVQGYAFRRAGENVAAGYDSVDSVMRGWMLSPGHRANILGKILRDRNGLRHRHEWDTLLVRHIRTAGGTIIVVAGSNRRITFPSYRAHYPKPGTPRAERMGELCVHQNG